MKRNIEINGLGPVLEIPSGSSESIQISPGKVRVNEGDAWYVCSLFLYYWRLDASMIQHPHVLSSRGQESSRRCRSRPLRHGISFHWCCSAVRKRRRLVCNMGQNYHLNVKYRATMCHMHRSFCPSDYELPRKMVSSSDTIRKSYS